MALLTVEKRKAYFKKLGLGEYNEANIKKFQKKAFPSHKNEWDGKYGKHTDSALRHWYNCSLVPNFEPEEFKCPCGRCTGYPTHMKKVELKHLQKIRDHFKKPMIITSGLRCSFENSRVGGVANSSHLKGYAADFYALGVTDTVANRKASLKWIVKQENHEFTYGANMKDSNGLYRTASGMGNAMHTETHKPIKKKKEKSPYYNETTIIGHACANEKNTLTDGVAGDQTKGEVCFSNWSASYGWLYVIRAKDSDKRLKIAQAMIDTVNNNNIGYDTKQPDRYTAWDKAEANGHNIKGINSKCETTCSQAVSMCMRASGISKEYARRHYDIATMTKYILECPDFKVYNASSYTKSSENLQVGDILLSSHHTAVVVKSPNAK